MKNLIILLSAMMAFSCSKPTRFELLKPEKTGITFRNDITETDSFHVMSYEYIYNGAGTGIGDLNNDGLQDIVFAGNQVSSKIYLNQGAFKFRDITSNAVGLSNNQWFSGVTLVDINNDGWLDIYLTSTGPDTTRIKNRLWMNNGTKNGNDPTFTEMAEKYGIADEHQSVNAAFFDYDLDGDLDLYILNNTVTERMNTTWRPKITDGTAQNNDQLYRNNGDGTFSNVTIEAGIVYEGFGLGLAICDLNKDGYPDIYVSNDYMSNDLLYMNQKDGTFKNEIARYLSYQTKSSMGNDIADVNNDGFQDIYTMDMFPEDYAKKKQTINGFSYIFYLNDAKFGYEHQYLRNMLHLNNGLLKGEMNPFSETGQMMGIYQTDWSWSPLFADYDNDGDKDLLIANGYPKDMTDKDWTRYKAEVYGSLANEKQVIDMVPAAKVPNRAYENTGRFHFDQKTKEWLGLQTSYSYGAAFADLDNDGDLDYVTNNIDDYAFVYRNTTVEKSTEPSNYLRIKLKGSGLNTGAIGAKVELWSNGSYQYAEHYLTRGYASTVDPTIHFGLGDHIRVDSLKITWPSSELTSVFKDVQINRLMIIDENKADKIEEPVVSDHALLFEKLKQAIDYQHEQEDFPDFFLSQKTIPHKFSQIGPCMTQGDLNGDGINDILIGSSNKLPTTAYLRKGDAFIRTSFKGLTEPKSFSESALAVIDIDNDGDQDVIALAGGYENEKEEQYGHYLYINNKGNYKPQLLPIPQFPGSVVKAADLNHDGYMELFIGSRVKKDMYPYANHSWVILNDKGRLFTNPYMRFDLGMVTDAIWTDFDHDGWEDLLIAREWNTLVLLKNNQGKELIPTEIPDLNKNTGIWYSLIQGDFDNDGDEDYIAGNLGDNHRFTVSDEYPLRMYAMDIDMDGTIDPLFTSYWKNEEGVMTEYPVNYLDELWGQSAYFQRLFVDYAVFSKADVNHLLTENMKKSMKDQLTVNTTSSFIIWNDRNKVRWEKLPLPIQMSPVRNMIVTDLNADGLPDVIVSGNDHTWDLASGYYDANKGFVMLNQGKAGFKVLSPSESGLLFNGMVESLLYLKGNDPLVVAGINRNQMLVYKQQPAK